MEAKSGINGAEGVKSSLGYLLHKIMTRISDSTWQGILKIWDVVLAYEMWNLRFVLLVFIASMVEINCGFHMKVEGYGGFYGSHKNIKFAG